MRTVIASIRRIDGTPWGGAQLSFALINGTYTATHQQPVDVIQAIASPDGSLSVSLWENAQGINPSWIRCTLPGGDRFDFVLSTGPDGVALGSLLSPPGLSGQAPRIVVGAVARVDGSPWAGGIIEFILMAPGYGDLEIYPISKLRVTLNSQGAFSQPIWANGGSAIAAQIKVVLPTGEAFFFVIPPGAGNIALSELRAIAQDPTPAPLPMIPLSVVDGLISAHNLSAASHPNGIAGGGGGGGGGGYRHTQSSANTSWMISHNLGRYPNIMAVDLAGNSIWGTQFNHSLNISSLRFAQAIAGTADCI